LSFRNVFMNSTGSYSENLRTCTHRLQAGYHSIVHTPIVSTHPSMECSDDSILLSLCEENLSWGTYSLLLWLVRHGLQDPREASQLQF
jgi:hypothetical protein